MGFLIQAMCLPFAENRAESFRRLTCKAHQRAEASGVQGAGNREHFARGSRQQATHCFIWEHLPTSRSGPGGADKAAESVTRDGAHKAKLRGCVD